MVLENNTLLTYTYCQSLYKLFNESGVRFSITRYLSNTINLLCKYSRLDTSREPMVRGMVNFLEDGN